MMDSEILKEILAQYGINASINAAAIAFGVSSLVSILIFWFQKKLEAVLDTKIHITKTQFDVEYNAYRDIWSSLVELRNATLALRPIFDQPHSKDKVEEIKRERLQEFGEKYNQFSNYIEKNQPFYAANVYSEMTKIRDIVRSEAIEYEYMGPNPKGEDWTKAIDNRREILNLINSTCYQIRERLASISIIK